MGLEHEGDSGGACSEEATNGLMRMMSDIESSRIINAAKAQSPELSEQINALNSKSTPAEFATAYAALTEVTKDPDGSLEIFTEYIKRKTRKVERPN